MSYRAGLLGWKLAARAGVNIKVRVYVVKDEEAGVYVATSPDLSGLTVEAESLDELRNEIHGAASKLLELELHQPSKRATVPLRALLVWRMCSDPWPGGDMAAIDDWLNSESRAAGFSDWIDAYHRL